MYRPSEHSPSDPRRARNGRSRFGAGHGSPTAPAPQLQGLLQLHDAAPLHGAWLVAPMMLLALACGLRLAVRGPDSSFDLCFALLLGLGVAWTAIRLWAPAPQAPACPNCKRRALVRMQALQTSGARCLHCGWRDEAIDATLLGVLVVVRPQVRGALHGTRPAPGPRDPRPAMTDETPRRPGSRPGRGPSGRGRRLR